MDKKQKVEIILEEIDKVSLISTYMEKYYRRAVEKALEKIDEAEKHSKLAGMGEQHAGCRLQH